MSHRNMRLRIVMTVPLLLIETEQGSSAVPGRFEYFEGYIRVFKGSVKKVRHLSLIGRGDRQYSSPKNFKILHF